MSIGRYYIGTSGWSYPHWVGPFYPPGISPAGFLQYYLGFFNSVELNNTFYRLPQKSSVERWGRMAPDPFLYSVKGSRYITHMKRLRDTSESMDLFLNSVQPLGGHLGPLLFQLPKNFKLDLQRLKEFLVRLTGKYRYVFEFRDPSWFTDSVFSLLEDQGAGICIYDIEGRQSPIEVTTDFVYVRLHGPLKAYQGSYSDSQLREWAFFIRDMRLAGRDCFLYFDNDQDGHAPLNALRARELLEKLDH